MIKSIQTTNFKALQSASIDFSSGLNILKGPNGVGKSSLMQALKFAFYGAAAVPGKKGSIATWGKKKVEVILNLEDGHQIVRTLSDCRITLDDKEVASGNAACSSYIAKHLDLDLKGFEMFHFSNQGETAALLTLGATELQRRVESHAGVAMIDKTIANARDGARSLAAKLEACIPLPSADIKTLQKQCDVMEKETLAAADAVNTVQALAEVAKETKDTAIEEVTIGRNINQRADKLQRRVNQLTDSISLKEQELAGLREEVKALADKDFASLDELQKKLAFVEDDLTTAKSLEDDYNSAVMRHEQLQELFDRKDEVEADIARHLRAVKELESAISSTAEDVNVAEVAMLEARDKLTASRHSMTQVRASLEEAVCYACHRPFDNSEHSAEQAKEKLSALEEASSRLEGELGRAEAELASQEQKQARYVKELNSLKQAAPKPLPWLDMEREQQQAMSVMKQQIPDTEKLQKAVKKLEAQITLAEANQKQLTRLQKRDSAYTADIEAMEAELEGIEVPNRVDVEVLEQIADQAADNFASAREAVVEAKSAYAAQHAEFSRLETELKQVQADAEKAARLAKDQHLTGKLIDYLTSSRERFMASVWDTILGNASHFCRVATKDWLRPDGSSKQITDISRRDGAFYFSEAGIEQPIESGSGAQRAFIGVGVRLGMSVALKGSHSLLILDEPTSDMRSENANALAGSLLGLPGQVIMITHRAYEELSANNVIDLGEVA